MLLTIAIPVLNNAKGLKSTLESMDASGFSSESRLEIVISDNCSSDKTLGVASEWAAKCPRARVYSQRCNLGFSGNFDFLAGQAKGLYIWFIGAGDTLIGESKELLLDYLEFELPDWGVVNGAYEISENNCVINPLITAFSKDVNSIPVFNHAISLNIMKTSVARSRIRSIDIYDSHKVSGQTTKSGKYDIWEGETRYWPHLEAVAEFISTSSSTSFHWFYFDFYSVHLDLNDHGSWDRGFSAMKIYCQWVDVVHAALIVLPNSVWLDELYQELNNKHLLRFLFQLRKDANISRSELYSSLAKIPDTSWLFRILAILVISLTSRTAYLLAYIRSQLIKIL